jgi:hypothetical protein
MSRLSRPSLLVTIDTEEEGLWSGAYRRTGNTAENTRGIVRFQALCDQFGIRPTYLVDTPVVDDERSVELLREIQDSGRGEVGAHLHPWCTPPFEEDVNSRNSYLCNLPLSLQRAKLQNLTVSIAERFRRPPTAFRAGRYGLNADGASLLYELGYVADSSVIPFTDHSADGGPSFEGAPHQPYYPDRSDIRRRAKSGKLLEIPVSVGFATADFARAQRLRQWALRPIPRRLHAVGILDRLGLATRIKFSPEQANADQMKRLADCYISQGARCMVLMFHSSSLVPGFSPYVPDGAALERFYRNVEETFGYCCTDHCMLGESLTDFAHRFQSVSDE